MCKVILFNYMGHIYSIRASFSVGSVTSGVDWYGRLELWLRVSPVYKPLWCM